MSRASKKSPVVNCSSRTASGFGLSVPGGVRSLGLLFSISLLFNLQCYKFSVIETESKPTQLRPHDEGMNVPAKRFRSRDRTRNNQFGGLVCNLTVDSKRLA